MHPLWSEAGHSSDRTANLKRASIGLRKSLPPRSRPASGQLVEELPVEFVVVLGRPHGEENVTSHELVDDFAVR